MQAGNWRWRWLVLCGALAAWASGLAAADDRLRPYSYGDFDRDIKYFVRQFREAEDAPTRQRALANLCQTYVLLSLHPHFAQSEQVRGMRSRVRHHLQDFQKQLRQTTPPAANSAAQAMSPAAVSQAVDPTPAAEMENNVSRGTGLRGTGDSAGPLAENMGLLLQFTGGPVQWHAAAGSFAPGSLGGTAEALDLVRLIQATIAPAHWDVNGGPGHIHYYAPQGLLVIRAGMEPQAEVEGLLQQLRDQQ